MASGNGSLTSGDGTPRNSDRKRARTLLLVSGARSHHDVRGSADPTVTTRAGEGKSSNSNGSKGDNLHEECCSELSVDSRAPGLLRIFGESVVAGVRYKTVLASNRSTAQQLLKQALVRFGLSAGRLSEFALCEVAGRVDCGQQEDEWCNCAAGRKRSQQRNSGKSDLFSRRSRSRGRQSSGGRQDRSQSRDKRPPNSARTPEEGLSWSKGRKDKHRTCLRRPRSASPKGHVDSPRTPLGSPRTPCGSPSTSRHSTITSVTSCHLNPEVNNNVTNSPRGHHSHDSRWAGHNGHIVDSSKSNDIGYHEIGHVNSGLNEGTSKWTEVSLRVLANTDRPLLLHGYWKPPPGLSRRLELRRRRDLAVSLAETDQADDTSGLNSNARKIMMSKLSPGVIPESSISRQEEVDDGVDKVSAQPRTTLKEEWDKASMMTNATLTYGVQSGRASGVTQSVEGDTRQAYVCPSIYPYLLTLRGCSIQRDLVLYPLKSRTLAIGSGEKKRQSDDICLFAEDVLSEHCRLSLRRLPQDNVSTEQESRDQSRLYWYCLQLVITPGAHVTVNGTPAVSSATVYPGDLLGVGAHYLFLYKDPTGGNDIPASAPWLPSDPLYARVCRDLKGKSLTGSLSARQEDEDNDDEEVDEGQTLNDSTLRDAAIFLAYHRDKEIEVMETIAQLECVGRDEFPSCISVLYLAAHHYSIRKFSGDHQATFFKRLVRVIRNRLEVVSKSVAQQTSLSAIFNGSEKPLTSRSEPDPFTMLLLWMSNILTLLAHFRSGDFQTQASNLARRADITSALKDCVRCLEETVNFLFQQSVYTVTKALYVPVSNLAENKDSSSTGRSAIDDIITTLDSTQNMADSVVLHPAVTKQLLVYLLFFLSTTLFNKLIGKGSSLFSRQFGTSLQGDLTKLENWTKVKGIDMEFCSFSQHLMSLADLLASSKRSLLRLTWEGFQRQFSPLTDAQLMKVLSEYDLGEGAEVPHDWIPSYPVDVKQDLTLSLSKHPKFHMPPDTVMVNLSESFPPSFYRRLEQVQHAFCLRGEDAYYSGLSSAGNTPRLSDSTKSAAPTFFLQDSSASSTRLRSLLSGVAASRPDGDGQPDSGQPQQHNVAQQATQKPHQQQLQQQQQQQQQKQQNQLQPQRDNIRNNRLSSSDRTDSTSFDLSENYGQTNTLQQQHLNHHYYQQTNQQSQKQEQQQQQQQQQQTNYHKQTPSVLIVSADQTNGDAKDPRTMLSSETNRALPVAPPPYNLVMESRRHTTQSQLDSNHQPNKPEAHAAILKHYPETKSRGSVSQSTSGPSGGLTTLPNFHRHHPASKVKPHTNQRPAYLSSRPALASQHSWANPQRHAGETGIRTNRFTTDNDQLAASYPLLRPRPSSATEMDQIAFSKEQREEFYRQRSNSALGNSVRANPSHGASKHPKDQRNVVVPPNYEHIKDSGTIRHAPFNSFNAGQTNVMIGKKNLSHKSGKSNLSNTLSSETSEVHSSNIQQHNPGQGRLQRSVEIDLSEMTSSSYNNEKIQSQTENEADTKPPPLPPKGEFLRRRSSVEHPNTNAQDSSNSSRARLDSDPTSRSNTVEIQSDDNNQYLVYNPNQPVQEMLNNKQNFKLNHNNNRLDNQILEKSNPIHFNNLKVPSSTMPSGAHPSTQYKPPEIPPLELPDDLVAASDSESPDAFSNSGAFMTFKNTLKTKSPSLTKLNNKNQSRDNAHLGKPQGLNPHHSFDVSQSSSDRYPDDIYIDVPEVDMDSSGSATSLLKVLPLEGKREGYESDPGTISVRYRHIMPASRDSVSNGETTGEIFTVHLNKLGSKLGMGLIDGLHTSLQQEGIYVRNVLPDTPAALCGAIRVGDRILAVNGRSIVGDDYQSAMSQIRSSGSSLELLVAKCDRSVASKISTPIA